MDTTESEEARNLLASGDVPGLLRHLRADGDVLPLGEVAQLVGEAARLAGFDDLAQAAAALSADGAGQDPLALYNFGYACIERGTGYLAVRPLERALKLLPDAGPVLSELVAALEGEGQHARAITVLEEHEAVMQWLHRFQYVYNAILAGSLGKAADGFRRLPEPDDPAWIPAREKVRHMLARAEAVRTVSALGRQDLRGWHYILTGGILAHLSPYGFKDMSGRYCYLNDSARQCAAALARLKLILGAADAGPQTVAVLPDRSSQILGAAAARLLGLPMADFSPAMPAARCLVVAYSLTGADPGILAALRERTRGQVLFERATCWTVPPRVTADICGLLGQVVIPPWEPQLGLLNDGTAGEGPPDGRPVDVIAAELASTAPDPDPGDSGTPPDPDGRLCRFAEAVSSECAGDRGGWLGGLREYISDTGPVPSSRLL